MSRRYVGILLLIGICHGLVSSVPWLYPLLTNRQEFALSYVPVRVLSGTPRFSDDYLYYSYVQDVWAGHPFSKDPTTFEGKQGERTTVHSTFGLSLALGSLAGIGNGNLLYAFCLNLFFFPLLTTILLGLLCFRVTRNPPAALLITVLALQFFKGLTEFPHPLITTFPLLAVTLVLTFLFGTTCERQTHVSAKRGLLLGGFLVLLIGTSLWQSLVNFFLGFSILSVFTVFAYRDKTRFRVGGLAILGSVLLSAPMIYTLAEQRPVFNEILVYAMGGQKLYHSIDPQIALPDAIFFAPALCFFSIFHFVGREFFVKFFLAVATSYVGMSLIQGSVFARYAILEGKLLILALAFSGFYCWLRSLSGKFTATLHLPAWAQRGLLPALLLAAFGYQMTTFTSKAIAVAKEETPFHLDTDFRELADWARRNTRSGDVAVSLDFDVLLNLLSYAPIDAYIPQALVSPLKESDREARFFESVAFYGISPEAFQKWISAPPEFSPWIFLMYYGLYWGNPVPEVKKNALANGYRAFWAAQTASPPNSARFTHRASHWIVSSAEVFRPTENSLAHRISTAQKPVFENSRYRVYPLP